MKISGSYLAYISATLGMGLVYKRIIINQEKKVRLGGGGKEKGESELGLRGAGKKEMSPFEEKSREQKQKTDLKIPQWQLIKIKWTGIL